MENSNASWIAGLLTMAVCLLITYVMFGSTRSALRYYGCYAVYIAATSTVAIFVIPVFCLRPFSVRNTWMISRALKHITEIIGITWELRNGDILAEDRGAVIVANHQSILDILGMFNIWEVMGKCATVAKKEVFYVWPFGIAAWLTGTVFIDRTNARKANEQINKAAALTREEKVKLWIFPEGTRKSEGVSMLPFKKGAFRVAVSCQVPIIPVVFSQYYFIDNKSKYFGRGKIIVTVLPEIPTKGFVTDNIDVLMEQTRNKMVETYEATSEEMNAKFKPPS